MKFRNRTDAGKQLADKLENFLMAQFGKDWKDDLLVIGLPRGGVPVAFELARRFSCPLEVIVAKKLPYPGQPEYAIGAVSADGMFVLNSHITVDANWRAYINEQRQYLLDQTKRMEKHFYDLAGYQKATFDDKTIVIVDDGVATGMTAIAAVESARSQGARRVVMAAPVMSVEAYHQLRLHCDEVVAVTVDAELGSVGQHYENFEQTSTEEVVSALRMSAGFRQKRDTVHQVPGIGAAPQNKSGTPQF